MGIHQLSVNHDERQDRLLWRVNTQEGEEFRFWLTRRMTTRLLPAIEHAVGTLETQRTGIVSADAPTRQMVSEMQREAFMQKADFKTPYAQPPAAKLPLGEQPLLITDAQMSVILPQMLQLVLQDKSQMPERQCQLQMPVQLVHGLIHLTQQALAKANWGIQASKENTPPAHEFSGDASAGGGYAH